MPYLTKCFCLRSGGWVSNRRQEVWVWGADVNCCFTSYSGHSSQLSGYTARGESNHSFLSYRVLERETTYFSVKNIFVVILSYVMTMIKLDNKSEMWLYYNFKTVVARIKRTDNITNMYNKKSGQFCCCPLWILNSRSISLKNPNLKVYFLIIAFLIYI